MPKVPPRDWTDISWPDIGAGDTAHWIAVLPLAATEQHGPHLPLATDVMIAQAYLERVRETLPAALPVTFMPIEEIGISTEHTAQISLDALERNKMRVVPGLTSKAMSVATGYGPRAIVAPIVGAVYKKLGGG